MKGLETLMGRAGKRPPATGDINIQGSILGSPAGTIPGASLAPPALLGCTWRLYGGILQHEIPQPSFQHTPSLPGSLHPFSCPADPAGGAHPAPWELLGTAFLFIFKVLTAPLCPSIGFLLWAFLSVLVKWNHFVPSQELGAALR